MAYEFHRFPEQYATNLDFLKSVNNEFLTGASILEELYNKISSIEVTEDKIIYT